jgi:hypothetical protein
MVPAFVCAPPTRLRARLPDTVLFKSVNVSDALLRLSCAYRPPPDFAVLPEIVDAITDTLWNARKPPPMPVCAELPLSVLPARMTWLLGSLGPIRPARPGE